MLPKQRQPRMPNDTNRWRGYMPDYLTLDELCTWLKIKRATVYEWVRTGYIPYAKIGRLLRFDRAEIVAWVNDRRPANRP